MMKNWISHITKKSVQLKNLLQRNILTIVKQLENFHTGYTFVYVGLFSIALCYTIFSFAVLITPPSIDVLPGVIFYEHSTQTKLISFILLIPLLFILWGLFAIVLFKNKINTYLEKIRTSTGWLTLWLLWGIFALIMVFQVHSFWSRLLLMGLFLFPMWRTGVMIFHEETTQKKFKKILFVGGVVLFVGILIRFSFLFGEFVFKPVLVGNEYWGISSQFIDSRGKRHDSLDKLYALAPEMTLPKNNPFCLSVEKMPFWITKQERQDGNDINFYIYEQDPTTLCLAAAVPDKFKRQLQYMLTEAEYELVLLYSEKLQNWHDYALHVMMQKENNVFLQKERYQYMWQVLSRGFLHHHNHFLGVAYQYVLGRPLNEIFMQYGFLQTVGLGWLLKTFNRLDYVHYIHFYYLFYFVYFASFLIVVWIFFQDKKYLLVAAMLLLAGWLGQSYLYLYLGPGTNPARYLGYLSVLVTLFVYIKKNRWYYLFLSLIGCWLAVAINLHFGMFSVIALLGVLVVKILTRQGTIWDKWAVVLLLLGTGGIYHVTNIAPSPINSHFFSGLLGFPYRNSVMVYFFLFISMCYGLLIWNWNKRGPHSYAMLFMTFFSQGVFLYYLRSAGYYHFCAISSILLMLLLLVSWELFKHFSFKYHTIFCFVLIFLSLVTIGRAEKRFHRGRRDMKKYFSSHQLYKWAYPGTGFYSTMNPADFRPSVELIKKYASSKGIYMISYLDNILPFLAQTYNRLPFIDLQWYLITQGDFDLVLETLQMDKPEYLFVDADIDANHRLQVIPADYPVIGYLHEESLWRAERMNLLNKLFQEVVPNYEFLEETELIRVYRRKADVICTQTN